VTRARAWAIVVALGLTGLAAAQIGDSSPLTAQERERLVAGELVRRPTRNRQGGFNYVGGTSFQRVAAPRDRVWAQIQQVESYPHLIPALYEARLIEEHGNERIVHMQHRYSFVAASYYARVHTVPAEHTVHFELDPTRPHDVRAGRGFITIDRYHRTESMVSWGVMADAGAGLISGILGPLLDDWILRTPECVKDFIESGTGC